MREMHERPNLSMGEGSAGNLDRISFRKGIVARGFALGARMRSAAVDRHIREHEAVCRLVHRSWS